MKLFQESMLPISGMEILSSMNLNEMIVGFSSLRIFSAS
jgi:hypothetical protein